MLTCTWAPTVFRGTQVLGGRNVPATFPHSGEVRDLTIRLVRDLEELGLSHLLIAQRWWGSGEEIEASSLDCLAMTALFAGCTDRMNLITAIHPGFFQPTSIAKWGATIDQITNGRWSINITSGWNMTEFDMYGIDKLSHDERYERSAEFIEVIRAVWENEVVSHDGRYYRADELRLEPRPTGRLTVFQGGQSDAAIAMAAEHSDWMFLNGGPPAKIGAIISKARSAAHACGRELRFAMYAAPLCRQTDAAAWAQIDEWLAKVDSKLVDQRRTTVSAAEEMWSTKDDPLSVIDSNEGYAARLIGSPDSVMSRIEEFRDIGVDMLHLDVRDELFRQTVLPAIIVL